MAESERQLCINFAPVIFFDKKEPFSVRNVGCTVFRSSGRSPSFSGNPLNRRTVRLEAKKAVFAIEYAYYFDYDIQHLYELEHIWVYVSESGAVCGCEGSFHGKYLNEMTSLFPIIEHGGTHVQLYSQPGKHAFLPRPELFELYPDPEFCCCDGAGNGGLSLPEMFEDIAHLTDVQQEKVRSYIKKNYAFIPTWEFFQTKIDDSLYISWSELSEKIPQFIAQELQKIGAY